MKKKFSFFFLAEKHDMFELEEEGRNIFGLDGGGHWRDAN